MGKEKFQRPITAPSFTPNPTGIALADLASGTNGQVPVATTSGATAYRTISGDITLTSAGVAAIGASKVTAAKAAVFYSAQVSGTGSSQNVAHGLGVVPTVVLAIPTDGGTVTYGTHTTTNVVITGTSGKKFDIVAWA